MNAQRRLPVTDKSAFLTTSELGKTRKLTPEGYLVCEGVRIARIGAQAYSPYELPLTADASGTITVSRAPEEVFSPTTIASFQGKPITMNHPAEFVGPRNWREHEVGTVCNARRGEGTEDDLLIADLLVKDPAVIRYINQQRPEVSAGYDADYEQTGPGRATQRNIIGNHVALVDRGRAGSRCAIRDHSLASPRAFGRAISAASMAGTYRNYWATRGG